MCHVDSGFLIALTLSSPPISNFGGFPHPPYNNIRPIYQAICNMSAALIESQTDSYSTSAMTGDASGFRTHNRT